MMLVDVQTTASGRLRVVFRRDETRSTLIELSINPVGGRPLSIQEVAQIHQAINDLRFVQCVGSSDTISDGDWDEVIAIAKLCHQKLRAVSDHVITTLRVGEAATTKEIPLRATDAGTRVITHEYTFQTSRAKTHSFDL